MKGQTGEHWLWLENGRKVQSKIGQYIFGERSNSMQYEINTPPSAPFCVRELTPQSPNNWWRRLDHPERRCCAPQPVLYIQALELLWLGVRGCLQHSLQGPSTGQRSLNPHHRGPQAIITTQTPLIGHPPDRPSQTINHSKPPIFNFLRQNTPSS